jgi:hypothetical protein
MSTPLLPLTEATRDAILTAVALLDAYDDGNQFAQGALGRALLEDLTFCRRVYAKLDRLCALDLADREGRARVRRHFTNRETVP